MAFLFCNLVAKFCRDEFYAAVSKANVDPGIRFDRFGGALLEAKSTLVSVPGNSFAEYLGDKFNVIPHSFIRGKLWPGRL